MAWIAAKDLIAGKPVTFDEVREKVEKMEKEQKHDHEHGEIKAVAMTPGGDYLVGTKGALYQGKGKEWKKLDDAPGYDTKGLCVVGDIVWVANKKGLHQRVDGKWLTPMEGDFHSVTAAADGAVVAVSKKPEAGVWRVSLDGKAEAITLELPAAAHAESAGKKKEHDEH